MHLRTLCLPVLSIALSSLVSTPGIGASLTFYVSPIGNDSWSGHLAAPAADGRNGPLATVTGALKVARAARERSKAEPVAINVVLRAGTYTLAESITLTPEDSAETPAHRFTIANYPGETPILSGGVRITGWKRVPGKTNLWQAVIPDVGIGKGHIRSLFVNDRRAVRARTPNAGAFFRMQGERLSDKPAQFKFRPGDIRPHWVEERDAEIVAFEKWINFRHFIRTVLVESNIVRLSTNAAPHTHEAGARYFVENTADALDAPGEWYHDRKNGVVIYWPEPGEDLAQAEVVAPRLTELLLLKGDLPGRKPIRHVMLSGLTFSHTDWTIQEHGYTDSQAAVRIPGELRAEAAVDCVIEQCTFSHLGGYAIDLGAGCQRNRVVGNHIFDMGAGGIRLGEPAAKRPGPFEANHSHTITDNHLHQLGRVYAPAVGVLILQSGTNRVAHNHIHDLYYTAVSVGWNWGYEETPCRENAIEFNHMHDIGQFMLSDMGAVYTLGILKGTVIRNNLIHDVNSFTYGGWGLYTDEGSSDIVLENNVVYRCKSAGFHQHYGRDNIVRNNVFAFGKEHQIMRSREEAHRSFTFTNNIVYFNSGTLLGSYWSNDHFAINGNVYFDARAGAAPAQMKFVGATFDQWRARGHDTNSMVADPIFLAPEKFDFRLKPESPALKLGFRPIDVTEVGPRPKSRWQ